VHHRSTLCPYTTLCRSGVEVDGGDERLHGVGEDRGLLPAAGGLLSLAHPQIGPEVEGAGHRGELLAADRRRPDLGELAFRIAGRSEEHTSELQPRENLV